MLNLKEQDDRFLGRFRRLEGSLGGEGPAWLVPLRRAAIDRYREQGFPGRRDEEWKYTSVKAIREGPFADALPAIPDPAPESIVGQRLLGGEGPLLVFVNGGYRASLSHVEGLPAGVRIGSLAEALREAPASIEPHLGSLEPTHPHAFQLLNTAFFMDGAYLHLPAETVLEAPVHLLFLSSSGSGGPTLNGGGAVHLRNLIVAEKGSAAVVVEDYTGEGGYLTNTVTEIVTGAGASLDRYKLEREPRVACHVAGLHVRQGRDSVFRNHFFSSGGGLVRDEIEARLDGTGGECSLWGLYLGDGERHVDNHTTLHHARPHCRSWELYRGILHDRARGIFSGKIHVHPDAQKTDAKQSNNSLLLSGAAEAKTRPRLEIYADDVRCTHGATVGQLDDDALFYLRARGIEREDAYRMLIGAFAGEVVKEFRCDVARARVEELLAECLQGIGKSER
ncbi:MAG: Fe-S cluster assembly protein SufD [Planctomycetota bacterium]